MLKNDLVTQIAREARIEGDANLRPLIVDIVSDLLLDRSQQFETPEFLKRITITGIANPVSIPLVNAAEILKFEILKITISGQTWQLSEWEQPTQLPKIPGQPFGYRRLGDTIELITNPTLPWELNGKYYSTNSSFSDGPAVFEYPKLIASIKKEAIARINVWHGDMARAGFFQPAAQQSTKAAAEVAP